MRSTYLILLLVAITARLSAQTEKGRFWVSGAVDISGITQADVSQFNLSLTPALGVFAVKNFAIGGRYSFGIGSVRQYNEEKGEYRSVATFTTAVGPRLSYYIGKKALKGLVSANGNYTVFTRMTKGDVLNLNGFSAGGFLGMAYFLNPHLAVETGIYCQVAGYEGEFAATRIGFSVGIAAFLNKKKKDGAL